MAAKTFAIMTVSPRAAMHTNAQCWWKWKVTRFHSIVPDRFFLFSFWRIERKNDNALLPFLGFQLFPFMTIVISQVFALTATICFGRALWTFCVSNRSEVHTYGEIGMLFILFLFLFRFSKTKLRICRLTFRISVACGHIPLPST